MKTPLPIVAAVLAGGLAVGCSKSDAGESPAGGDAAYAEDLPSPEEAGLVTPEEAAKEAEAISPEDADQALNELEAEIGQG